VSLSARPHPITTYDKTTNIYLSVTFCTDTWYALSMYLQFDADCNDSLAYGALCICTQFYTFTLLVHGTWIQLFVLHHLTWWLNRPKSRGIRYDQWRNQGVARGHGLPDTPKNIWNPAIASLLQSTYTAHTVQIIVLHFSNGRSPAFFRVQSPGTIFRSRRVNNKPLPIPDTEGWN